MTYLAYIIGWCIIGGLGYWGYRFCARRVNGRWSSPERDAIKVMAVLLAPFLAAVALMALLHECYVWCRGRRR